MSWQNNGDGDRPNPWGNGQKGGGGRGGGNEPNLDEAIRKGQEALKNALPGGKGGPLLIILILLLFWVGMGIYRVQPNEQGVVLRFGERTILTGPGLHWHMPYPIETVEVRGVTNEETISIGNRAASSRRSGSLDESLMLTQDENIVDVRFNVVWQIKDLGNYLFKLRDPEGTIKAVAESVMRELVGQNRIVPIITTAREALQQQALEQISSTLDSYESGVRVLRVQIIESEAPEAVKDAFLDVQRAEADQQRSRNEAARYANEVIPAAQGEAERMTQQAEAYRAQTVARAEGEAARFTSVYNEYVLAKDVTRKRIYLETMEGILSGMDKIILEGEGSGVVPYLPLNELNKSKSGGQ
ncbi:FtsH protease activity modulator HflK [Kordiimonas aquimaris]|uniref:FtsH protease activity modulator HflK n=1 Tax=Kordiimonas aquimaris TaxID=707591 RepID=UPI0021D09E53|nr:FtsH protease activity modulator HflK [Kordiimonas aquimaris]